MHNTMDSRSTKIASDILAASKQLIVIPLHNYFFVFLISFTKIIASNEYNLLSLGVCLKGYLLYFILPEESKRLPQ